MCMCLCVRVCRRREQQEAACSRGGVRQRGAVLVFLPGLMEIREFAKLVDKSPEGNQQKLHALPLHSSVTLEEQRRVFMPVELGKRKVILATNIAESSITVPDIKYVFDFGLVKQLTADSSTGFESLRLAWISHAAMLQRKGRAGRVSAGHYFCFLPLSLADTLPAFPDPEMIVFRCFLHTVL